MRNKACYIIDDCFDCPNITKGNIIDKERPSSLDDYYCDEEHRVLKEDPNGTVSEIDVPNWCPILQPDCFVINKPKN